MKNFCGKVKEKVTLGVAGLGGMLVMASGAHAALTLPTLPVTDVETAGGTVAAFVAAIVVIGCIIRLIKKA